MLFFNANFICYYFYPTKKREEPKKDAQRFVVHLFFVSFIFCLVF